MPFDPRIHREPEDPNESFPADLLAELGTQLTEDAQHLAALYPAHKQTTAPHAKSFTRPKWLTAAALFFMLASAASWFAYRGNSFTLAETKQQVQLLDSVPPVDAIQSPAFQEPQTSAENFVSTYENLTGPEWEGLLDLLEQESSATASLSL